MINDFVKAVAALTLCFGIAMMGYLAGKPHRTKKATTPISIEHKHPRQWVI